MPASDSQRATTRTRTGAAPPSRSSTSSTSYRDATLGVFALLLAFRIVNALALRTFFQPDEFFQSLEPAWQLAFGRHAHAWITWEWTAQLRSSLHPALFAAVYQVAAKLAVRCGLSLSAKAELLLAAPKVTQALSAALMDCYTWKLAEKAYGRGSRTAFITVPQVGGPQREDNKRYEITSQDALASISHAATIASSVLSDRLYYQVWTLPPLRFLYFNIIQSLAVFYGRNRADYYLTEGLPLLLTTALPFTVVGLWQGLSGNVLQTSENIRAIGTQRVLPRLAWTSLIVTASLSLIAHKEVRFLYPILPFLHILAAGPLSSFFPTQSSITRKGILTLLLFFNLLIAGYASQIHQRGVIDVLTYLRHKHEASNIHSRHTASGNGARMANTTVAFLMPCHSTPWRSHLVYPEINAWALTCEPPLDVPLADRSAYLDEADQFYISPGPAGWLRENMEDVQTVRASGSRSGRHWGRVDPNVQRAGRKAWPQHLVFFAQLEPELKEYLQGTTYRECWRGFNSHFHDDWRRKGDVLVWCLD
ncbi:glycosylphosphatidylinositol anchor biosynthesis [Kalmusia sp. IMI 367209]|nr:glycosylphosphatidylinositol anchor biosynthesis [Kalmusia sp. IMI 367209]